MLLYLGANMTSGTHKKSYTFHMILRCASFLGLLAVLALADFYILNAQIKSKKFDAELINIAGRQRLLFERTALLARYLVNTPEARERANVREQLLEAIRSLEEAEGIMIHGNPDRAVKGNPPALINKIYFDRPFFLHTRLLNYLTEIKVIAFTRDENLARNDIRLNYIRTIASGKILKAFDWVTEEYTKMSALKISRYQKMQKWVLGTQITALLLIGLYLLWPMIRQVRHDMDALENLNADLEHRIQEQKRVETSLLELANEFAQSNKNLDHMGQELRNANARLEKLALLDPLTDLLNRRGLQQALTAELQRAGRDQIDLYAILVDLDDFKQVNDTLGYPVGDIVLKEIASRFRQSLRITDYVARIGGDEFIILLPRTRRAEGMRVAEKIRYAISDNPILLSSGKEAKVTASLGLTLVSPETPSIDELLAEINPVLHTSKKFGKNRVSHQFAGAGPAESVPDEFEVISRFHSQSIQPGQNIYALKQPIFHLSDLSEFGYEFLSRSSIEGFEMPDDFFRICLEANILTLVDHQCFKVCVNAGSSLPRNIQRHLNLFPSTILNIPIHHLVDSIPKSAEEGSYCIEISEQQIIGDPSYLVEAVREIKRHGIRVGIDDVGFGRSCLESLILLEPQVVKIDKKCVKGISQDVSRLRSLKQLLKVVNALGADVIAEGIETHQELDVLRDLGVKFGQGYLLGRPR